MHRECPAKGLGRRSLTWRRTHRTLRDGERDRRTALRKLDMGATQGQAQRLDRSGGARTRDPYRLSEGARARRVLVAQPESDADVVIGLGAHPCIDHAPDQAQAINHHGQGLTRLVARHRTRVVVTSTTTLLR